MVKKRSSRKELKLPLPLPLLAIILFICATYRYILPLKVEMIGWPSQLPLAFNESNRVVIEDFFKPYDPAYPTSLPTKNYYRRINLRPLAPYRTSGSNFSLWLEAQTLTSFEKLLANIGDSSYNNLKEQHVAEGAVIASPSKEKPDYFYQWPRDAAITVNTVVSNLIGSDNAINLTLARTIVKYLNNSALLQRVPNPSGQGVGGSDPQLKGLGEPKFEVDSTAFTGSWGRPQNDGAPLRLIASFHFLKRLAAQSTKLDELIANLETPNLYFQDEDSLFETLIRNDLEFLVQNWEVDSFDLWEEVKGRHFFTSLVQLSATQLGLQYMKTHGKEKDPLVGKLQQASNGLNSFLTLEGGFLNPNKNYIVETPSNLNTRSGLDVAVLIASLLAHADMEQDEGQQQSISSTTTNLPFAVNDSGILNTLHSLVNVMAIIYPVNHERHSPRMGVALGRYPEDVYDGAGTSEGNPWFLATSNAAQLLYQLIHKMYADGADLEIPVNTWESKFWTSIFEGFEEYTANAMISGGDYRLVIPYKSPAFHQTMVSLLNYGDSFLDKLREHVSEDGSMSEQFNKYTGIMQGARDLTWSHGAFWSSSRVREQVLPLISAPQLI